MHVYWLSRPVCCHLCGPNIYKFKCVYACVHTYTYIYTCYIYMYTYVYMYTYIHVYIYIRIFYMYTYWLSLRVFSLSGNHVCACIFMYIYTYIHIYKNIYTHAYPHTHTHINTDGCGSTYIHIYTCVHESIHIHTFIWSSRARYFQSAAHSDPQIHRSREVSLFLSRYKANFSCAYKIHGTFVRVWKCSLLH